MAPLPPLFATEVPERQVAVVAISPRLFSTLRVSMEEGTGFTAADFSRGALPACVMSYGLWVALGSPRGIIGNEARLGGRTFVVRGVAPRRLALVSVANLIYVPGPYIGKNDSVVMIARLRGGAGLRSAQEWLANPVRRNQLRAMAPSSPDLGAEELATWMLGPVRRWTSMLLILALALIALSGCAAAALLATESAARRTEWAIRWALGASRAKLFLPFAASCTGTLLGGAAIGIGLSPLGMGFARHLQLLRGPRGLWDAAPQNLHLSAGLLAEAVVAAAALCAVVGLLPAVGLLRSGAGEVLGRAGITKVRAGSARFAARWGLIAVEVTSASCLCSVAAAVVLSLAGQLAQPIGFSPSGVVVVPLVQNPPPAQLDAALRRLQATPGVAAAAATGEPFGSPFPVATQAGYQTAAGTWSEGPIMRCDTVTPRYFQGLGIPLIRGRAFGPEDSDGAPGVAIVNETLAALLWPGGDPIGRRFDLNWPSRHRVVLTVIGMVPTFRDSLDAAEAEAPKVFFPYSQQPGYASIGSMALLLRYAPAAVPSIASLSRQLNTVAPQLEVRTIALLSESVRASLALPTLRSELLGLVAAVVFVIAFSGVYATLSAELTNRRHDFAIRAALGAGTCRQLTAACGHGLLVAAAGSTVGATMAFFSSSLIAGDLYPGRLPIWAVCGVAALVCTLAAAISSALSAIPVVRQSPLRSLNVG